MSAAAQIRYAVVFLAVAIGVALVVAFLNTRMQAALGSPAQPLVPAMIAAAIEGNLFARRHRRKPDPREAWCFAGAAAGLASLLALALAHFGGGLLPEFARLAAPPALSGEFLLLLGLYAAASLICNRIFLTIGAGNRLSLMRSRGSREGRE